MISRIAAVIAVAVAVTTPALARAHCDTLDGPVVSTARTALDSGKIAPVLAWVQPRDEAEIRAAYQKTLAARKLGPAARDVADTWFLETLVRVHRAGEGAPFTGLKPAGTDLGPAVPAADEAIRTGNLQPVEKLLSGELREGLHKRFAAVRAGKAPGEDVAAGRAWVAAYVPFVHYVEGVYEVTRGAGGEHGHAGAHEAHAESSQLGGSEVPAAHGSEHHAR